MSNTHPFGKFLAHSSSNPTQSQGQGLDEHLLSVACSAGEKAAHFNARTLAEAAGLLHDLGKYCLPFQQKLAGAKIQVDHSTWGAKIALEQYKTAGYLLAYGIAGHHAGLANGTGDGERSVLAARLQDKSLPNLERRWQEEIHLPAIETFKQTLLTLKQNERSEFKNFQWTFLVRMLFSALVDADYLDTEKYYDQFLPHGRQRSLQRDAQVPELETLRQALNQHLQTFTADSEINQIRAEILAYARKQAAQAPGIFSMNVPTGGGKTLASLAFALDHAMAHGQRRVIFVIPFTSIVEQNAAVFRKALHPYGDTAVLEHHSAFTAPEPDRHNPEHYQSQEKLKLAMENWDAPIIVTTAVQFFESLFASKPSQCRKLHNISNSVIVLDEVQTIPLHVLRPAVAALDELARNYRSSIVLCTATQPALESAQFKGGFENVRPLVQDANALAQRLKRARVRHIGTLDDAQLAGHLRTREQVLCIVNNRLHARAVYQAMSDLPGAIHLSTLMCAKHRSKVLADARQRLEDGAPCRIVSTSLIEAGVDISLPTVMRAQAGLDSIAQAAGRCNRNKEWDVQASEVLVFANANPNWKPPPELEQFAQTAHSVLRQYPNDPLSPAAIRAYFEELYWKKGALELDSKSLLLKIAESSLDNLPMETLSRQFRMIENTQQPIIVGWDDIATDAIKGLRYVEKSGALARKLQPYIVQVPRNAFAALHKARAIQPIAPEKWGDQFMELVNPDIYSEKFGLWWEEPTFMKEINTIL